MTTFLSALAGKAAEKWLALLVLPGVVYLAGVAAAVVLGHAHALDLAELQPAIDRLAAHPGASNAGAILLVAAGVLAAATLAGMCARASAVVVERLWTSRGDRWPARLLVRRRVHRWQRADAACEAAGTRAELARAIERREAIALVRPRQPTWIGDRLHAVDQRVYDAYGLELGAAWPRLWLTVPDAVRAELLSAREAYGAAFGLAGWAALYLLLGAWWWPALSAAAVVAATAWIRGRSATAVFADLVEATVDLHAITLAQELGLTGERPALTREVGDAITTTLRKDPPPDPHRDPPGVV
ncbi:hypothetical protein ACFXKC_53835 [Streptomyces sp. NPDC059340]|uniref:hypothetical protein n=1 Tax=Streptomyces sp. NPDC059340 TaxID=3346806 RepID=UPI0036B5D279